MAWQLFEALLSLTILFFMGRLLFFLLNIYSTAWTASIFVAIFCSFSYLGSLMFPMNPGVDPSVLHYFLNNYSFLFSIPFLFAVIWTHVLCLLLIKKSAAQYYWEENIFYLLRNGDRFAISREDIKSVSSMLHIAVGNPWRTLKVFKLETSQGTFFFDEAMEKSFSQKNSEGSFWSIKDGQERLKKNADFYDGKSRASYFFENFGRSS